MNPHKESTPPRLYGDLRGQVCIITGAARGIGEALTRALAAAGAKVVVADVNLAGAQDLAQQLNGLAVEMDVTNRESVRDGIAQALDWAGQLTTFINNAGISMKKSFLDTTEEQWDALQRVNVLGTLIGMQEAAKHMRTVGGGKIINVCSTSSRAPSADFAAYAATKAAALSLVQSGAKAFAPDGITVNGVGPGIVDTDLWKGMERTEAGESKIAATRMELDDYKQKIPLGRVSTPEDVAPVVVFLASTASNYMTGQLVLVDGGMVI